MKYEDKIALVPLWHRSALTLEEATAYTGIVRNKLIELSEDPNCDFVIWTGRKRLFKRRKLDEFIDNSYSF